MLTEVSPPSSTVESMTYDHGAQVEETASSRRLDQHMRSIRYDVTGLTSMG
jgi:hypothetical protein